MPEFGGSALQRGVESGSNMFANLLGKGLQQAQLRQAWKQHMDNLAIKQAQEERAAAMAPYMQNYYSQLANKYALEANPAKKYEMLQGLFGGATTDATGKPLNIFEMDPTQRAIIESVLGRPLLSQLTPAQKEALQIHGSLTSEDAKKYVADRNKLFLPTQQQIAQNQARENEPEFLEITKHLRNAVPMNYFTPGRQAAAFKEMTNELHDIQAAKETKYLINEAKEIMRENPDLYRKAVGIIVNPEKDPNKVDSLLRALIPNEEQLTPFLQLDKLYSDILTKQAQKNGMSRSVYGMRLQARAKAQTKNPDKVNELIFQNILHEIEPKIGREQALLHAMQNNMYLPYTIDYESKVGAQTNELPTDISEPTPVGMMKGIINGKEVNVHPSQEQDFIAAGGKIKGKS
jgi:hypothetical protein